MKGHSSQFIIRAIPLNSKLGNRSRGVAMFTFNFAMVLAAMFESKIY